MDYISQLPSDLRQALLQQDNENVADKIKAFIAKEKTKAELEESRENELTKAQKAKDIKDVIMSKDQAFEKAYELLCQITKMDGTDVMAGIALISAKRDKDYAWMAQQFGDFIDLFGELKKILEE